MMPRQTRCADCYAPREPPAQGQDEGHRVLRDPLER